MKIINADSFRGFLVKWQSNLRNANECGGCAAELMGHVIKALDERSAVLSIPVDLVDMGLTEACKQKHDFKCCPMCGRSVDSV